MLLSCFPHLELRASLKLQPDSKVSSPCWKLKVSEFVWCVWCWVVTQTRRIQLVFRSILFAFYNVKLKAKKQQQNVEGPCVTLRNGNRPFLEDIWPKKIEEELQMVRPIWPWSETVMKVGNVSGKSIPQDKPTEDVPSGTQRARNSGMGIQHE